MRVFDVADGVEFCTLAHNLTSAPNWVKQFTTVVVMQTLTTRRSRDLQKKKFTRRNREILRTVFNR